MQATILMLSAALALTGPEARPVAAPQGEIRLTRCLVSLINNDGTDVPAQEPGQIIAMEVKEGRLVEAGALLGRIDDQQPQAQREERQYDLAIAKEQAENDVNVRFAKASLRVAVAELEQAQSANRQVTNAVSQAEVRRLALNVEKVRLQIEQAEMEQRVAEHTSGAKAARLKELDGVIERREIRAPISGQVVQLVKDHGEWVNPGDTVIKMVRLDTLRVEGFLNARDYSPDEVENRPVTIKVQLAHGREETFPGKIVYVDPRVQAQGEFRVYAEVVNRMNTAKSQWLLRPGSEAEMAIDLRGGVERQASVPVRK